MLRSAFVALLLAVSVCAAEPPRYPQPTSLNALVLRACATMPGGGGYDTTPATTARLGAAISSGPGTRLSLMPDRARPSYCSGATYLVFLEVVKVLRERGQLDLPAAAVDSLLVRDNPTRPDRRPNEWGPRDGEGFWGRWNANGPGTARLFRELRLGRNFEQFSEAHPGDFLKIWWNDKIGASERGHSVVFLGSSTRGGVGYVRFWSSNQGAGYGEKEVPRSDIKRALFSRFEHPSALRRAPSLPPVDQYLYDLAVKDSTPAEMRAKCGVAAE